MSPFILLETKTSEADERILFSKKFTTFTPDFFILFFFSSLIIFSCTLDPIVAILLFYSETNLYIKVLFLISAYVRVIFEQILEEKLNRSSRKNEMRIFYTISLLMWNFLGVHSLIRSSKILMDTFDTSNNPQRPPQCNTYPIFHISDENLSIIKIYCYIYLMIKSIPQLFIISVFMGQNHVTGITAYFSTANIALNIIIFAFTMSITLPIRKKPRIFINFGCLVLSATNKFLATVCGCYANLTIFAAVFRHVDFYAFLIPSIKMAFWVFPCQALFSNQSIKLSPYQYIIYLITLPLIFSFIFIHPFEKTWRLYYYFFYLFSGFIDLAFLGVYSDMNLVELTYYYILKITQIGFISCYGLLNSLTKGRNCEFELIEVLEVKHDKSEELKAQDTNGASSSKIKRSVEMNKLN